MRTGQLLLAALLLTATAVSPMAIGQSQDPLDRRYDFEQDKVGQLPQGWTVSCTQESRTTAAVTRLEPASGRQCVEITKEGDKDFGNLMQSFDATPYYNKRVRFRASVRTRATDPDSRAQLWMRVDRRGGGVCFLDNMRDRPIRSNQWNTYEIVCDVHADADDISIGIIVFDPCQVWFDDVAFVIIGEAGAPPADIDQPIKGIAVVVAKDFMRLENSGPAIENLRFPRYFPVIDEEQFALARWVIAKTDEGEGVEISISDLTPDPQGNLIHTYRIGSFPADEGVVVTVTSLMLRREKPAPKGDFPIPAAEDYPEEVQPFLQSTPMVVVDHTDIQSTAAGVLAKTHDAYEAALEVAEIMRQNTYEQRGNPDPRLPVSARVLKHGGSCCGSAVCAAAILRACGIPAQVTYCPAGYVHGVLLFYLKGYGWCRMDATSGVGRLPFVQKHDDRGMVRLFDMPIEMEKIHYAYAWPYEHNTIDHEYRFYSNGRTISTVRFAAKDEEEARREGRVSGRVSEPFPHLEPGSWNTVLAIEDWEINDAEWTNLAAMSRRAAMTHHIGVFEAVAEEVSHYGGPRWLKLQIERIQRFGDLGSNSPVTR